ncbi:MAG: polyprenyl synthetase family protein [Planctomycetaceae bacterium]|jgi:octaprenyl-diphosphate synthase|nr:polyprenyl synthetase family protein [Planctomycetaceae bacterium]
MPDNARSVIADDIAAMEMLLCRTLTNADTFVDEVIRYSLQVGGKRLRPMLLFLAGKTVGTIAEQHILAAASIELVHTATLIHDDILDGASVRRHLATFNVRWNAQIGVLAGDFLLTKALELIAQTDSLFAVRQLTAACKQTCEGELLQIGSAGGFEISFDDYLRIIGGKTAPLLACSAEIGAFFADADVSVTEKFRLFGQKIGLAFQIIDDVLDLVGKTDTAGKTLRTDLIHHKPTLPLILYLRDASEHERNDMLVRIRRDDFDGQTADEIVAHLTSAGSIAAARKTAQQLADEADELLAGIPGNAAAKQALSDMTRFVVSRQM